MAGASWPSGAPLPHPAPHPEQLAWLREHPEAIPNAVEEMVRWVTPFVSMSRTATRDVEMHGQTIREGDEIMMLYPAANRQPDRFPDPFQFDIRREFKHQNLSFGYGPHFCIGARLARAEARIVFEELFPRVDELRLTAEPTWTRSSFMRGITSLRLGYRPRVAEAA